MSYGVIAAIYKFVKSADVQSSNELVVLVAAHEPATNQVRRRNMVAEYSTPHDLARSSQASTSQLRRPQRAPARFSSTSGAVQIPVHGPASTVRHSIARLQSRGDRRQTVTMEDFNTETDSDYTSYWRDWVSFISSCQPSHILLRCSSFCGSCLLCNHSTIGLFPHLWIQFAVS